MATAVVTARPSQALRQRREPRPGLARVSTRATTVEANEINMPEIPTPLVPTAEHILKKFDGQPPSLVLHLHPTHFRFDQQDGNFGYNSEMRFILEHLRFKTVPHQILGELFESGVRFYDGCLIVEVHNHRKSAKNSPSSTTNQVGSSSFKPFSVHNHNEHITPSPFVPYPDQKLKSASPGKAQPGDKSKDKMPAPGQPASAMQKKPVVQATITTTVLFPTPQSQYEELALLARTPYAERSSKRQGNTRDGATPTMAHPPTPLTSVPPTPLSAKGPSRHPTMILTEENAHEFEAEIINRTAPPLYLTPAANLDESLAILDLLKHPQHSDEPPAPKSRKRTVAELAADEAQAAEEERFMLNFDERHQALLAGGASGTTAENQAGWGGAATTFEPTFKRFKTLENIRLRHLENDRVKKEDEARKAQIKRQQQEADQAKKLEMEAKRAENERLMMNRQQQEQQHRSEQQQMYQQQQRQMAQAQQAALQQQQQAQNAAAAQQQANMAPVTTHAQHAAMIQSSGLTQNQQGSGAQMSPGMQQHPSMSASPAPNGAPMTSVPNTSVPMATSASNQGAGSPPRPPSTVQHPNGMAMGRQISQQHSSAQGTPQMHSTPSMPSAVPANRIMTPTPRMSHQGSPVLGVGSTPMMMNTSTPGQSMTPEQQQMLMMQQRNHALQQAQQAKMMGPQVQMSPQQQQHMMQQAMLARQQQQQQQGMSTPTGHGGLNPANANRLQQMNGGQIGMMGAGAPGNAMMGMPNQAQMSLQVQQQIQQQILKLNQQYSQKYQVDANQRLMQFRANWQRNGGVGEPPPQEMAGFHAQEERIKAAFTEKLKEQKKALYQRAAQSQGMSMQPNMMPQNMTMQQTMAMQQAQAQAQAQAQHQQQQQLQQGMVQNAMINQTGGMQQGRPTSEQYMQQLHAQKQQMAMQNMDIQRRMAEQQRLMAQTGMQGVPQQQGMTQQQMMQMQQMRVRQAQMQAAQQAQQQQMNGMGMQNGGGMGM